MAHSVTFRPDARSDLQALEDVVALRSGPERAEADIDRIEAACGRLAHFPKRGRALIAFRILGETVEIVAILYGGRDLHSALTGR